MKQARDGTSRFNATFDGLMSRWIEWIAFKQFNLAKWLAETSKYTRSTWQPSDN